MRIVFGVLITLIGIFFIVVLSYMNNVPKFDQNVKNSWYKLLSEYKQKSKLTNDLVFIVKKYAENGEKDIGTTITKIKTALDSIDFSYEYFDDAKALKEFKKNQKQLDDYISKLILFANEHPKISKNKDFLVIKSKLKELKNDIYSAENNYINAVKKYNDQLTTIPAKWVAVLLYPNASIRYSFDK